MRRSEVWLLGTWHTCLLVLLVMLFLVIMQAVDVLAGLSPATGLFLFAVLWIVSVRATAVASRHGDLGDLLLTRASMAGAGAAATFAVVLGLTLAFTYWLETGNWGWGTLVIIPVLAAFASLVGLLLGAGLASLDRWLVGDLWSVASADAAMPPLPE